MWRIYSNPDPHGDTNWEFRKKKKKELGIQKKKNKIK
jgi:ribosomal protein S8E